MSSRSFFFGVLTCYIGSLLALNIFLWKQFSVIHVCNTGISFSLQIISPTLLIIVSIILLAIALSWTTSHWGSMQPIPRIGWIFFLGGGVANGLERVIFGCVHDTFPFLWGISNNPADWSLALGGLLIVIYWGKQY